MALTRVDCDFFISSRLDLESGSFVALNPHGTPGSCVAAAAMAGKKSIGGQVACRLSLEHFVEGVLDQIVSDDHRGGELSEAEEKSLSERMLTSSFKRANTSVYQFGHKLAAGGRMGATLLGCVVEDHIAAAGRVGVWSVYLVREGVLYPFFDDRGGEPLSPDNLVGARSLITVETASVPIQEGDLLFMFAGKLNDQQQRSLAMIAEGLTWEEGSPGKEVVRRLFQTTEEPLVAMAIRIGPNVIYLKNPLQR